MERDSAKAASFPSKVLSEVRFICANKIGLKGVSARSEAIIWFRKPLVLFLLEISTKSWSHRWDVLSITLYLGFAWPLRVQVCKDKELSCTLR